MATLYIIQGFLGAGKTTFSKQLAKETHSIRLNADEWVARRFSLQEQENNWEACFTKALDVIWWDTKKLLREGTDVILDIGFWTKQSRDEARQKAVEYNTHLKHYYIFAPDEVLLKRLEQRRGPVALHNIKNFHLLKKVFEEPLSNEKAILIENYSKDLIHP